MAGAERVTRMNGLKRAIFNAMHWMGYTAIANWRVERYPEAVFLQKLLRMLQIDCVFDVGANRGQYHDFLRSQVAYEGYIVSFEPIPHYVDFLHNRAQEDDKWIIEGYALGSAAGTASFNVMANTSFSSFLEPDHSAVSWFENSNAVQERVEVAVKTLDSTLDAFERRLGTTNFYLKLDTQGFDMEVVRGAAQSMPKIRALQTEASVKPIYQSMPDYLTSIQTLQSLGFELSGIFPNNVDHFPLLIEFDCYMIARQHLSR